VNLMGAHLDYNGGPVMPMAIDRGTFVALRAREDDRVRLASTLEACELDAALSDLPAERSGSWYDYPVGVLRHLVAAGGAGRGADVLFGGNLPIGAGLSSSASICVGTAHAFDALWERGGTPHDAIRAALWAERTFVGVQCGIMDPFAVSLARPGHLLWIDCRDESVDHVPLDAERVTVAVADTGVRRALAQGAFNARVSECRRAFRLLGAHAPGTTCLASVPRSVLADHGAELDPVVARRAAHVLDEVERTHRARAALDAGDVAGFGREMTAAHVSLRDQYEVSIDELDVLVEAALEHEGVLGARLTGAGFGGCVVILLETAAHAGLAEHLGARQSERFGTEPRVEFFQGGPGPREV
jgi:galactokinase